MRSKSKTSSSSTRGRGRGRGRTTSTPPNYSPNNSQLSSPVGHAPTNYDFNYPSTPAFSQKYKDKAIEGNNENDNEFHNFTIKNFEETVLIIEEKDTKWLDEPWKIASKYFQIDGTYPFKQFQRIQYEIILHETGSIFFDHHTLDPSQLSHSKAKIMQIISIEDWGTNPNQMRRYVDPKNPQKFFNYNYWHYIDAWQYAFLYQNKTRKHSWFFMFNNDFQIDDLPNWFSLVWDRIGPESGYLPDELLDLYIKYNEVNPKLCDKEIPKSNYVNRKALIYFLSKFCLPWIWHWSYMAGYDSDIPYLGMNYYYKWWPKFNYEGKKKEIMEVCAAYKNAQVMKRKIHPPDHTPFQLLESLRNQIIERDPQKSEDEISKEIQLIFNSMISQISQGETSSVQSMKTSKSEDPMQDAQDPYEEEVDEECKASAMILCTQKRKS